MKKSIIKNISLGIACLLGLGGAITAGVLSTNSPSFNNAEATAAYKPYCIAFDSNLKKSWWPNTADATSGSALDGMWTWSNSDGVTFSEANFIYIQSSTQKAEGTFKHLKFTIQSGKTAQIAFHNNKEINLTGAGVDMYCDKELSMSVHDNIGKINISKNITGEKTRDTNEPGSAFVYGTTGYGLGAESYCDTMYIDFTNNQSSTAVIYICGIQLYIEDHMATYNLNGGQFPNAAYLNSIYCIGNKLYLYDYYDPSKIMTSTANPITIPVKENYVFKGFYKEDTFENIFIDETGYLVDGIDHQFTSPFNLYAKWAPAGQPVTIVAGTGVSNVFLSTSDTATSGDPSGTSYPEGTTVYAYVDLKPGYKPVTEWGNPISGSIYKIPTSHVMTDQPYDFGTYDADGKYTYNITYDLNGGNLETDNPSTFDVETATFTLNNPTKTGYIFTGWTGTGLTELTTTVTISQGSTGDRSYTAHYDKTATYTIFNYNGAYDGLEHTVSINVTDPSSGAIIKYGTTPGVYDLDDAPTYKDVGTHIVYVQISAPNFVTATDSATVTITKKDLAITADNKNINYGDDAPIYTYTASGFVNGEDESALGGSISYSCSYHQNDDAGVYIITPSGLTSDNYDIHFNAGALTVNKLAPTINQAPTGKENLIYTGSAQDLINAGTATHGTFKYSLDGVSYDTTIPSATNSGTYTVYYKVFGDPNYSDTDVQTLSVSIAKIDPVITSNPSGISNLKYTGEAQALINVVEVKGGEFQYSLDGVNYSSQVPTVTNAGNYTVFYYVKGDANHKDTAVASLEVIVSKIDSTLTTPNAKEGLAYTGNAQALVDVGSATGGELLYNVNGSEFSTNIPTGTNAGTYRVGYKVVGDINHNDIEAAYVDVNIIKANPNYIIPTDIESPYDTELNKVALPEGFSWMDGTQKTSTWGENTFKVKYTPADQANYNVVENIDIKVYVKWKVVDSSSSSASIVINGADEAYTTDISVKVEVKAEITVDQKRNEYASLATKDFVKPNEDISAIYGVKLIRTTNGVEEEIQPSDIKPGTKITVSMAIPEELVGKDFRLLHIHNSDDITEVTNYAVSKDGKTLMLEVDRLSDFAFITATDADNGFIYSTGLPGWALALIIVGSILLLALLALLIVFIFFPVYYIDKNKNKIRKAIYIRTNKNDEVIILNGWLKRMKFKEVDVYEKKSDALNALNK